MSPVLFIWLFCREQIIRGKSRYTPDAGVEEALGF